MLKTSRCGVSATVTGKAHSTSPHPVVLLSHEAVPHLVALGRLGELLLPGPPWHGLETPPASNKDLLASHVAIISQQAKELVDCKPSLLQDMSQRRTLDCAVCRYGEFQTLAWQLFFQANVATSLANNCPAVTFER